MPAPGPAGRRPRGRQPAVASARPRRPAQPRGPHGPASGRRAQRPQRGEGVVGEPARPHQRPQRLGERVVADRPLDVGAGGPPRAGQVAEEPAAAEQDRLEHGGRDRVGRRHVQWQRREQSEHGLGRGQRDPGAVAAGQRSEPPPHHLARRGELVEHRRVVVGHPAGRRERLQRARRQRRTRELPDGREHAVDPVQPRARRAASSRGRRAAAGLDTPARGARCAATAAGSAPPPRRAPARSRGAAPRPSGAAACAAPRGRTTPCRCHQDGSRPNQPPRRPEPLEHPAHDGHAEPEVVGQGGGGEGAVPACPAGGEVAERVVDRLRGRPRADPRAGRSRAHRAAGRRPRPRPTAQRRPRAP